MLSPIYEPHIFQDQALPFFFHHDVIAAGRSCWLNWHTNVEVLYCREGEGILFCEGRSHRMVASDILVINANQLHYTYTDTHLAYDCLIPDQRFCTENGIPTDHLFFKEHIQDVQLATQYESILSAYAEQGPTRTASIRHAVLGLMLLLYSRFLEPVPPPAATTKATQERIKEVIRYIRENLDKDLNLDIIAGQIGISKFYLSREFKKQTGQTLVSHINETRCKEAKRLIEGGMSISAAALSCGFENLSYFSRIYKRMIGKLPSGERASKTEK